MAEEINDQIKVEPNVNTLAPTNVTQIASPFASIPETPEEITQMMDQYNNLKTSIEGQITSISNQDLSVDSKALVGQINAQFGRIKNSIIDSALLSVKKAGLDMDTYFGSVSGDQRSGVRAKMSATVKNSMMQTAFEAIAGVYEKNTEMVVSTELEAAKTNISAAATKAKAIADFTGLATQAYLGVLSETNKSYSDRLNASVQWAQVQAQARGQDIQFASAMKGLEVSMRNEDLQASVAERGQDLQAETTRMGQDVQKEISFAQIQSQAQQMQLERDKANLQASLAVWREQGRATQQRWTPSMGGSTKTVFDLGSYQRVRTGGGPGTFSSPSYSTLFAFNDGQGGYYSQGGGYL